MGATFGFASRNHGGSLARFVNPPKGEPIPREEAALSPNHPALVEGRSVYPSRVFAPGERARVLISGHNNAKIGTVVTKGPWRGFPIFTLSLEERATCPRSCAVWSECYGNALPMSVRFKHGPALIHALERDLAALEWKHPGGFVVRLHVLGDFYDLPYVAQWWRFMETFPALHVWGYTAHSADSPIGARIGEMNRRWPARWSIRNSVAPGIELGPMQAATAWQNGDTAGGIVCPAETGATQTCGTCGLCWAPAAAEKRIVFLGHGKTKGGPAKQKDAVVAARPSASSHVPPNDIVAYLRQGRDAYAKVVSAFDALIRFHENPIPTVALPVPVVSPAAPAHPATAVKEQRPKRQISPEQLERLRGRAAAMRARKAAKYQRGDGPPAQPATAASEVKATPAVPLLDPPQPPANAPGRSDARERPSVSGATKEPAPQPKSRMEAIAAVSRAVDAGTAGPRASAPNSVSHFFAQPFGRSAEKPRATGVPSEDQIAAWIAKNGVKQLPAAAVEETSATIPEADRRAIAEHQAALDAAWREKNPQRNKRTTIAAAQAVSIGLRRADR